MKVHINELKTGSKKEYKVRWTAEGKPKEKFRKNYDDALALKIEIEETIFGDSEETYRKTFLTSEQLRDAEAAIVEIKGRLSLKDSARIALKHWVDKTNALSLKEAYWHYLEHIESKGLRAQTIGKYKQTALRLIDFFPEAQTIDLGYDTVEKFMSQFKHPSDFNNRRRELSNFLNFLKDKGWIKLNPFEQIKSKKVDTNPPEILSPTQVKELFKTAKQILPNECIAYLALSIFGAIRPDEMRRLSNKDNLKTIINLGTKMIKLPSNITKGRTPRNIIIRPALEALHLEDALLSSGIMTKEDDGYRIITWEEQNANLISNRKNGRKGGRKKTLTEDKETESNLSEWERNLIEGNYNKNIIENNVMEPNQREHNKDNLTELNITDGITHGKPTGNRPYSYEDPF